MPGPPIEPVRPPAPWLHAEAKGLRDEAVAREALRGSGEGAGDPVLSLAQINRAAALDPVGAAQDAVLAFHRGALLARLGRGDEAAGELRRSLVVDREYGGLDAGLRGRAWRGLGRLLGRSGIDLGDADRVQEALRCLNRALDLGARDGVVELMDELKVALDALPAGGVGLVPDGDVAGRGTDAVGLMEVRINDRAEGFGDRERVKARLGPVYERVFEPLRRGRAEEASREARALLAPRFRGSRGAAGALAEMDEADLVALVFLGSALRGAGRDAEAVAVLKAVMAQVPFQSRVVPEVRFVFRLAYQDLKGIAAVRGWMWVNTLPSARPLAELLGGGGWWPGRPGRPPLAALAGLLALAGAALGAFLSLR
ncbi:tetratricopeptide repeat protein [Myxococcota bacterium]|nr:tetratricopeptide repeat protein [Myxococcota bacterium]